MCTVCGEDKPATIEFFCARKGGKFGFTAVCRICEKERRKQRRADNYDKIREKEIAEKEKKRVYAREYLKKHPNKNKDYYAKNRERLREQKRKHRIENPEQYRQYKIKNREKTAKYTLDKYNSDLQFNIKTKCRRRIGMALRKSYTTKAKKTTELLGISYEGMKKHLESQFTEGMTWEKFMNGEIHIDHIRPLNYFDLTDPEEQKKAFHYTNTQPLWARDNWVKQARYVG